MLDTRNYEIQFPDDHSDEYMANVIAENMYAQCDIEGRQFNLMTGIIDHKTDGHAVAPVDMYMKRWDQQLGTLSRSQGKQPR
jgi:hypothetical protein